MRFHLDSPEAVNLIRGYTHGSVTINERKVDESVIVTPERIITGWPPQCFQALETGHLEWLVALEPEIVLLGTGERQYFPHPRLIAPLARHGVGIEAMDTAAACRTYNIVVAEGRRVAAALFMT